MPRQTKKGKNRSDSGFTLIEAVVVLFILGILSAISGPPILSLIASSRVDEAKSILNTAAAQCLRLKRTIPDYLQATPDILKERSLPTGYAFADGKNTCDQTTIYDPSGDKTTRLLKLSFSIIGDKVVKEAEFYNPDTEAACKSWGNCGGSPEAKAMKQCLALQSSCEKNLSTQVSSGGKRKIGPIFGWQGNCTYPPDPTAGCTRETWAYNGSTYNDQQSRDDAFTAAVGAACAAKLKAASVKDGQFIDTECGIDTWFFAGQDVNTQSAYEAKKCSADQEKARTSNYIGKYGPYPGAPPCGDIVWMCDKTVVTTQEAYNATRCGSIPSTNPATVAKPNAPTCKPKISYPSICRLKPTLPICAGMCP